MYFFLTKKEEYQSSNTHSQIMTLNQDNVCKIEEGTWLVFTEKYNPVLNEIREYPGIKYAVIVTDSIEKVEIAASVGISDPTKHVIVKDGICVNTSSRINSSFTKTIDYFIYYWALRLKKIIESSVGIDQLIESLSFSVIKMSLEIIKYCLGNMENLHFTST